jgi:hypothetical protein
MCHLLKQIDLGRIKTNMLSGSLITTVWHVFRLRMEETASSIEGSCEYTE